ncbi:MAG: hypothetical protein ACR2J1_07865 [Methyloceanibacter sp.]|uniref:hypothetical protein n=1 Tax=Methyloceanibacter sp. TaxID=1965321 RepID=UPI003D9B2554
MSAKTRCSGVIGITADSYLYRVGPTKVHHIVKELQGAYRDSLLKDRKTSLVRAESNFRTAKLSHAVLPGDD